MFTLHMKLVRLSISELPATQLTLVLHFASVCSANVSLQVKLVEETFIAVTTVESKPSYMQVHVQHPAVFVTEPLSTNVTYTALTTISSDLQAEIIHHQPEYLTK